MKRLRNGQAGFTIVEMVVTTCIIAVLASVAIHQMRDYTRRTKVSEVVMVTSTCKNMVSEGFMFLDTAPQAGDWGCENAAGTTQYSGAVQTSAKGVIRVAIRGIDPLVNGRHVYLIPSRSGAAMVAPDHLGMPVRAWICGSDWAPVRNALPGNCRADTTTYASQDFE